MKKWILITLFIVIIGGGAAWFFLQKDSLSERAEATVQTATVKKGKLEVAISGSGSVTATTNQE